MQQAIDEFRANIARCKAALTLYATLVTTLGSALDLTDLLRYAIASSIGAIDRYTHHVVEIGMVECQLGRRPTTPSYLAYKVSLAGVIDALASPPVPDWLVTQVRVQHSFKSFQKSSDIHTAINLVSSLDIWVLVARRLAVRVEDLRKDYDLFVERRHAIVHQADINPVTPGTVTPISEVTANDCVRLVEQIVESIHLEL